MNDHEEASGLGSETGANEAGSQDPEFSPGATPEGEPHGDGEEPGSSDAPANPVGSDNPEADPQGDVPQDGETESDPARAADATDGS